MLPVGDQNIMEQLQAMRRVRRRPATSSDEYLRRRAAKKKEEDRSFLETLRGEKRELETLCQSRMEEANKFSQVMGLNKIYQPHRDAKGMKCRVSNRRDAMKNLLASNLVNHLQEHRKAGDDGVRIMSLQMFMREHKKIQDQYKKHLLSRSALGGGDKESGSPHKSSMATAQFDPTEASLVAQRRTKPTRYETQQELKSIAESTRQLTAILQQQLEELQNKEWNSAHAADRSI